jgi:hypothetical protein
VQIVTSDQGNTGRGGTLSDTDTVNITVNAVNDAPVNSVPGRAIDQRRHQPRLLGGRTAI